MKNNWRVYLALLLLIFICIGFPMYEGMKENATTSCPTGKKLTGGNCV